MLWILLEVNWFQGRMCIHAGISGRLLQNRTSTGSTKDKRCVFGGDIFVWSSIQSNVEINNRTQSYRLTINVKLEIVKNKYLN